MNFIVQRYVVDLFQVTYLFVLLLF